MSDQTHQLTRRNFLRGSLLAAGALATPNVLAACSKPQAPTTARTLAQLANERVRAGAKQNLSVFLGGEDYVEGLANYIALGMADVSGQPVIGANATVWAAQGAGGEGRPMGPITASWAPYTKPDAPPPAPQGLNHIDLTFAQAGIWQILVEVDSGGRRTLGTAAVQVKAKGHTDTRIPGDHAIASQTPTFDNPRGIHPICTRTPPCPFHEITLAKAITLGKPTAFIVATPKFCQSRTCGPNLEELIAVSKQIGKRASFVHAEVHRSDNAEDIVRKVVSPTFRQWGFQSEPWLFLIDRNGIISKRFEGPAVAPLIQPALEALV